MINVNVQNSFRRSISIKAFNKFDDINRNYFSQLIFLINDNFKRNVDYFINLTIENTRINRLNHVYNYINDIIFAQIFFQIFEQKNHFDKLNFVEKLLIFLKRC